MDHDGKVVHLMLNSCVAVRYTQRQYLIQHPFSPPFQIGLQSVTQSEVDLERELAAPTAQTVMEGRRVSAAPTQPVQDIVVDISVDTDGGQQTQVTSNPTSNQDHPTSQSDRAQNETRNPRSDFHNTQAVNRRSSNRRDSPILISDPPPPYPGPPTNPSFVPPHNSWQSCAPGYNSSARGQTPVVIFDRYGQQLHGTIVPVLPGEIQYSDPYPVSNRRHLPSVVSFSKVWVFGCRFSYFTQT